MLLKLLQDENSVKARQMMFYLNPQPSKDVSALKSFSFFQHESFEDINIFREKQDIAPKEDNLEYLSSAFEEMHKVFASIYG